MPFLTLLMISNLGVFVLFNITEIWGFAANGIIKNRQSILWSYDGL